MWETAGLAADWYRQEILASQLTVSAQGAQEMRPWAVYVLCPTLGRAPVGGLEVVARDWPDGFTRDDAVEALTFEGDLVVSPPRVDDFDTRAGRAIRLRQRHLVSTDPPRQVIEVVRYCWLVPEENALLLASMVFVDLVEAAQLAPMLDAVARKCEIVIKSDPVVSS